MIFGGLFINPNSVPIYLVWIKYFSWFYYGFAALVVNQWHDVFLDCELCNKTQVAYEFCPEYLQVTGDSVIVRQGFEPNDFWLYIGLMCCLGVFYRLVGFLILLRKFRPGNG